MAKMSSLAIVPVMLLLIQTTAVGAFSVVAYGDSFTEGWDPATEMKTPYTDELGLCFQEEGLSDFIIDNKGTGWSGVLMPATPKIPLGNLTANVLGFLAEAPAVYDWSILWLAGVNDISNSHPPTPFPYDSAIEKYKYLWETLLAQGSNVLVMPQPTLLFAAKTDVLEVIRVKLAAMLKEAVAATTPPEGTKLEYLDIATILEGINTNMTEKGLYLSQGIHLKAAGYAKVGDEVCRVLAPYALEADAAGPTAKLPPGVIKAPAKSPAAAPPTKEVTMSPAADTPTSSPAAVITASGIGSPSSSSSGSSNSSSAKSPSPAATTGAAAMAAVPTLAALAAMLLCLLQWA